MEKVSNYTPYTYGEFWIEGIGSSQGLLYPEFLGFFEFSFNLKCYSEKGIDLFCNPLSIKQYSGSVNKVYLYPNPAPEDIIIDIENKYISQSLTLEIYNAIGEKVKTIRINSNTTTLHRSNFNAGYYVYKLFDNENTYETGKLIIQ